MARSKLIQIGCFDAATGDDALKIIALGSCIGLCLYDRRSRVGGMAHILLPRRPEHDESGPDMAGRYADTAIDALVALMLSMGASRAGLTARCYGGASMFTIGADKEAWPEIGQMNANAVKARLDELNIPIETWDVGGRSARTLLFSVQDGSVQVKTAGI